MTGCSCDHAQNEHGDVSVFGQRLCLVAGCDCNGTHAEVEVAVVQRSMAKKRVLHDLADTIRMASEGRLTDSEALDIALVVRGRFDVEVK